MKETTPSTMPPCFEKWCRRFDDVFKTKLVFCAYTFIIWHQLTGGFRRIWSKKPLNTFTEALEAFRTAITYRFLKWLEDNWDVFVAYKESFGYILA